MFGIPDSPDRFDLDRWADDGGPCPPEPSEPGNSIPDSWSCGCTNARVGVADFRALCLKCGHEFAPA
jgi:hypothetical protein